jgi:hypothetical protein
MASILKVDELRGIASAGDITVTSEGGAATQSLQQGLAKSTIVYDQTAPSITGSLNISSLTDTSTGRAFPQFTSNHSAADYSAVNSAGMASAGASGRCGETNPYSTSQYEFHTFNTSGAVGDYTGNSATTFGDLA